jgi:integrase
MRGTAKQAEQALAQMVVGTGSRTGSSDATLDELVEHWLASARLEASSVATYRVALAHLPASLGRKRIDRLTLADFDRGYVDAERAGAPVHQVHKLHTALSSALTQAVRWGWIGAHPARGARLPSLPDRKVKPPSAAQVQQILAEAAKNLQTHAWLRLAVTTGARRGEVLALRWSDIDLEAATMTVGRSLNEDRTTKSTKTNRVRVVRLDAVTVALLRQWRNGQRERALACGARLARDPFVLSNSPDSSVPWRPDGTTQRFQRLCARAGVEGVRLHDLRHAMASQLLERGVSPVTVAGRLGHASTTTTLRTYAHVVSGADAAAADVIADVIG